MTITEVLEELEREREGLQVALNLLAQAMYDRNEAIERLREVLKG